MLQRAIETGCECPNCKANGAAVVYWREPRFVHCRECDLIFRHPFPQDSDLSSYYKAGWDSPAKDADVTGATDSAIARSTAQSLARSLGVQSFSGMRILDFGAGRGSMSLEFMRRGAEVVAIEPFGHEFLNELGVRVYKDIDGLPEDLAFDGIVSLEVIEHLRDPNDVLSRLHERLVPGGWLFITTPNAAGLLARLTGQQWREVAKPGHVVFYTPATLNSVLARNGFTNVQRLRWLMKYPNASPLRSLLQLGMQSLSIDGGLRMIGYRPPASPGSFRHARDG
jgi:SAM-dependent methyltransferase